MSLRYQARYISPTNILYHCEVSRTDRTDLKSTHQTDFALAWWCSGLHTQCCEAINLDLSGDCVSNVSRNLCYLQLALYLLLRYETSPYNL
jgi:hypothetical protein